MEGLLASVPSGRIGGNFTRRTATQFRGNGHEEIPGSKQHRRSACNVTPVAWKPFPRNPRCFPLYPYRCKATGGEFNCGCDDLLDRRQRLHTRAHSIPTACGRGGGKGRHTRADHAGLRYPACPGEPDKQGLIFFFTCREQRAPPPRRNPPLSPGGSATHDSAAGGAYCTWAHEGCRGT